MPISLTSKFIKKIKRLEDILKNAREEIPQTDDYLLALATIDCGAKCYLRGKIAVYSEEAVIDLGKTLRTITLEEIQEFANELKTREIENEK